MKDKYNKKKRKGLKIAIVTVLTLMVIIVIATIGIGNYFINYALVPTGDGGNREVEANAANLGNETAQEVIAITSLIDTNRTKADKRVEDWKASVTSKNVSVIADDGVTLRGVRYLSDKKSNKWVILVHGYHSTPDSVLSVGQNFHQQGYNVLSISMRAHANSEGSYIGMGWLDRLDLLKWIDSLTSENPDARIVLHGTSMGGAAVMMVSGEKLPYNVKAIVEDSGYESAWGIFSSELKLRFNLPQFPILYMVDTIANYRAGYSFKEASALNQIKRSKIPILFIHGDKDDFVPVNMVYELYEAATGEKDILIVKGASHTEAKYAEPDAYYKKVFSFVDKYME
ncbi:MAG: alpha/beta hydrolase [Clostridiales bacterium]|nr:alpha/beta hydrolase [Clostridiales bacterium]